MIVKIFDNEQLAGEYAAQIIIGQIKRKPGSVIGFATGSSPLPIYKAMVGACESGDLNCSHITTFNLDEYIGLSHRDPQSFAFFMKHRLFDKLKIDEKQINRLSGAAEDPEEECRAYERKLNESGPIDIQILGIGSNGHIGFNEPDTAFSEHVHIERLTEETVGANRRFFKSEDDVPKLAMTVGIKNIMSSKKIILIACGGAKAWAVDKVINGKEDPMVPGSILRSHPDVEILLDKAAASALDRG